MQQRHDADERCAAQAALARLTRRDIAQLQSRLPALHDLIGRRAGLARLPADRAHDLALGLAKVMAPKLAAAERSNLTRHELETAVSDLLVRFPSSAVRVVLVVLCEEARIDTATFDRLVERTGHDHAASPQLGSPGRGVARAPLNTLVAQVIRVAAADRDDVITQVAVGDAVEELRALDIHRPGSWYLLGLSDGHGITHSSHDPPSHEARRRYVAGRIDAAAERDADDEMVDVVARWEGEVRDLAANDELVHVAARVLTALLDGHPTVAARIATAASAPFADWKDFLSVTAAWIGSLRDDGRSAEADVLTEAHAELTARWNPRPL